MQLVFEVFELTQRWKPPFEKKSEQKEFRVGAHEGFDFTPDSTEPVFKVVQSAGDKALVEYRRDFTPKGYEQPQARQFWFKIGDTREFSHLWGENGTTKKLTFKGIDGTTESISETTAIQTQSIEATPTVRRSNIIEA